MQHSSNLLTEMSKPGCLSQGTGQISEGLLSLELRINHHFCSGIAGKVGDPLDKCGASRSDVSQGDGVDGGRHTAGRFGFDHLKGNGVMNR